MRSGGDACSSTTRRSGSSSPTWGRESVFFGIVLHRYPKSASVKSDEDLVGNDFTIAALERELGALLVLVHERFVQSQGVPNDFGVGRGFGFFLQPLQALHRLGRHLELYTRIGALAAIRRRIVRGRA